jgi:hypothetical protein
MDSEPEKPKPNPKRNRRRSILKLVAGLMSICCLPPLYVRWQLRKDDLAAQAERVINLPGVRWYAWFDNDSLLLYKYTDVSRFNITTNVATPLPTVTRTMQANGIAWPLALSPNGNTLLAAILRPSGRRLGCIQLDGSAPDHWLEVDPADCIWLDSGRFLTVSGNFPKDVTLDEYTRYGVKSASHRVTDLVGPSLYSAAPIAGVSKGRALGISGEIYFDGAKDKTLFEINTGEDAAAVSFTASLPEKASVSGMSLSPQGDRIAWLLQTRPDYNTGWYGRLLKRVGAANPKKASVGIWVSNAKGQDFTCLGHIDMHYQGLPGFTESLQWTPNGARLSFLFKNQMYLFKAPR